MGLLVLIGQLFYFFLPAAVANMAPVIFQRLLPSFAKPIDGGRTWRSKRIFGDHKTWRGLFFGVLAGGIVFLFQFWVATDFDMVRKRSDLQTITHMWWPFKPPGIFELPYLFGFGMGFAAIAGDAIKSFFKRRLGREPGSKWFPFDQLDFIVAAALYAELFVDFTLTMWVLILCLTPFLHILVNRVSYVLQIKDRPW